VEPDRPDPPVGEGNHRARREQLLLKRGYGKIEVN
jgi:hypothetical protein